MPRKHTKPAGTNIMPDEYIFVHDILAVNDGGIAPYLRRLMIEDAQRRGYEWPNKTRPRGKYERKVNQI